MSAEETQKNLNICKDWAATEGVDKVINQHKVDVIVAPADSFFAGVGVGASELTTYQHIAQPMRLMRSQDTLSHPFLSAMSKVVGARTDYMSLQEQMKKTRSSDS